MATTTTPVVLFVGNDASSTQIAESLLRHRIGDDRVEIHTAGAQPPNPGGREDQMLVMMGLNPAHEERLSVRALNTSDRVIILGTGLDVARMPGRHYEEWDLDTISLEERIDALAADLISGAGASTSVTRVETPRIRLVAQQIRRRAASSASRRRHQLASRLTSARRCVRFRAHRRHRRGGAKPPG